MLGACHRPLGVMTHVATLDPLPERELRAGLAEVIKHALALDLAFVEWLEKSIDSLLARERSALVYAVRRCCELKAGVVAADERESGVRSLLNFGHTFGHAIEAGTRDRAGVDGQGGAGGQGEGAELCVPPRPSVV